MSYYMSKQTAFNRIIKGAREQREKSEINNFSCMYRHPKGLKCFIGMLIRDQDYHPDMESATVLQLFQGFPLEIKKSRLDKKDKDFYNYLQTIHDCNSVENWENEFVKFANYFGLKYHAPT